MKNLPNRSTAQKSPKGQEVARWLRSQATPDGALPSIRATADALGVSTRTVRLAVRDLQAQGWLESRPGRGLWRKGFSPARPSESVHPDRYQWERVAKQLQQALEQGEFFNPRHLPGSKELAQHLRCSQPTLRKALRQLEARGVLVRSGSRWALKTTLPTARRKLLLIAAYSAGQIRMETFREIEFFRCAEEEALHRGLELQVLGYDEARATFLPHPPGHPEDYAGVLFSPWHLRDAEDCLHKILEWKFPVSVWLENSEDAFRHHAHTRRSGLAFFSIGYGEEPGVIVGKHLQAYGHSRAAYLSPFHGSEWSQARLRGLEKVLGTVQALTASAYRNAWTFRDRVESSLLGQKSAAELLPAATKEFSTALTRLRLAQWREATCELARDGFILQVLQPLLRQALRSPDLTAWVFANDLCAVLAQGQLQQWHVPRSQWPAMVAFDNSPEAFIHTIDSYEFNTRGMVRSMIHHVLAPRNPLYKTRKVLKPSGHVASRGVQKKLL